VIIIAKLEIKLPTELISKTEKLADKTDAIIEKSLLAGGKVVLEKVRGNLRGVIGKGTKNKSRSTGELLSSLGLSPVKVDRKGVHNAKIGFNEPRRQQSAAKGKRSYSTSTNAMLANVLEYGRQGQPPKPFLKPARSASRKACIEAMQNVINDEVQRL
jgi:HK97 gp10 family phage protein